jgi:hypothetical protein
MLRLLLRLFWQKIQSGGKMLEGRLEIVPIDFSRALLEGSIILESEYEMTTMLLNIYGANVYVTPFDITCIKAIGEDKLTIGFSVIVAAEIANGIIDAIAIRN